MSKESGLGQHLGHTSIEEAANAEAEQRALSRRSFLAGSAAILAGGALVAAPRVARAHDTDNPPSDVDILNYALTLEHLEAVFYRQGLEKFSAKKIKKSQFFRGSGKQFIRRSADEFFELIRDHEIEHVDTVTKIIQSLGGTPVPEATYNFESTAFTSVEKFIEVAQILENTGVTAYGGAIAHVQSSRTNPEGALLTGGAQIATVEARHASYLNLVTNNIPFPNTFDTPVAPRVVFDDAAQFITTPRDQQYGPYPSLTAFRERLPTTVIGGIPTNGL